MWLTLIIAGFSLLLLGLEENQEVEVGSDKLRVLLYISLILSSDEFDSVRFGVWVFNVNVNPRFCVLKLELHTPFVSQSLSTFCFVLF